MGHLNYDSLNNHPDLILYQESYRKESDQVFLARGRAAHECRMIFPGIPRVNMDNLRVGNLKKIKKLKRKGLK